MIVMTGTRQAVEPCDVGTASSTLLIFLPSLIAKRSRRMDRNPTETIVVECDISNNWSARQILIVEIAFLTGSREPNGNVRQSGVEACVVVYLPAAVKQSVALERFSDISQIPSQALMHRRRKHEDSTP